MAIAKMFMINDKNFPPVKEAAIELEAAIDGLQEVHKRPLIYRSTSELLKLDPEPPLCSFCGKGVNQVTEMINGNDANICDQCVMLCSEMIFLSRKYDNT